MPIADNKFSLCVFIKLQATNKGSAMNISAISPNFNTSFKADDIKALEESLLNKDAPCDSAEFSIKNKEEEHLTKEEKQEIIRKANTTAAGWSMLFSFLSTVYFGLRSDETVAKKYNLDPEKDKNFIKTIKSYQLLWTLPGIVPSIGSVAASVAWLFNKNRNAEKIDIDRF